MIRTTRSLEAAVRAIAEEARVDLDEHPSLDRLADHRAGRLSPDEDDRVQDHLALCRSCTTRLLELAPFSHLEPPEGWEPVSEQEVEAAWREMGPELLAAVEAAKPVATLAPARLPASRARDRGPSGIWAFFSNLAMSPRFAYALAALFLLAAPLTRHWTVQQLTRPEVNITIGNLVSERDGGGLQSLTIPREASNFLLVLNLVPAETYSQYVVEVAPLNAQGPVNWQHGGLQPSIAGNFNLLVSRKSLPPGKYLISLFGQSDTTRDLIVEYRVQIEYR